MFETTRALLAPQTVQSVPWEMLLAKLKNHYVPMPSQIARHHAFHHRNQAEDETIHQFVAALRSAALYCDFRDLDDVLLNRVVCGVRDLWRRLLAKTDLTLQTALDEARAAEMSNQSTAEIQKTNSPSATRKSITVHHDELDPEEVTNDDDIHHLKTAQGKGFGQVRGNLLKRSVWAAVEITHKQPADSKMPIASAVGRKAT